MRNDDSKRLKLCCLMPTYGRRFGLIENAISCFVRQDYPQECSRLLICDDEGWLSDVKPPPPALGVMLISTATRAPNLSAKYNVMIDGMAEWADGFVVWDDDDIYLPHHLAAVERALTAAKWAHPRRVWSTYTGRPELEDAAGRFHGSLAVRANVIRWPETRRADFDQRMIAECQRTLGDPGRPDDYGGPSYVFRWGDTGTEHCQGFMLTADDETWWDAYAAKVKDRRARMKETKPGALTWKLDNAARGTIAAIQQLQQPKDATR